MRRDKTVHHGPPVVRRTYHYDRRAWDRRWHKRYHRRYDRRGFSVNWHFWYGPRVIRYKPYWYYPRRFYRHGRPVVGFYVRIPSFRYWSTGHTSYFVYKQDVRMSAAYRSNSRDGRVEVHTRIRQHVRRVFGDRVEIEYRIEGISLFDDGYFIGEVTDIPRSLATMKVKLYNDGYTEFDRMSYLIGDPEVGFELISTRYYGGHLLNEFRRADGMRVGELDLYDERVRRARDSRLFFAGEFNGFVPVALMPDDEHWGFQYLVGGRYRNDDYYFGSVDYYDGFDAYDDDRYYSSPSYYAGRDVVDSPRTVRYPTFGVDGSVSETAPTARGGRSFANSAHVEYALAGGETVRLDKTVEIEALDR